MKTAYWIGAVIIILIVLGLIVHAVSSSHTSTSSTASNASVQTVSSTSPATSGGPTVSASGTPGAQHFIVNGNDATADLKTITVAAGTPVSITFGADAGSTYHGGLDFRSSVVNTGTIAPGNTKTISFTAMKSFSFTPYWPSTNIAKPYTIDIVVK